ncbi:hypothetical protein D9757_014678 [Collybiopsis confluens]|uniref:Peptide hydrolase n=1 Tax=Collybiopsis confluens TaxID=2823264 RepID=A0A8H5CMJ1_9AGAR|nr:hypothetical protein D9757_014678 [Collybiopsis confluens]
MSISTKISLFFARTTGFLTLPVTTVLVLVYLTVIISTLVTDQLPAVPSQSTLNSRYGGLNVSEAYEDLHIISARPHPYHSHANDVLREYLLQRVRAIRARSDLRDGFLIDDDITTSGTWSDRGSTSYFEGNNILVKIRGMTNSNSSTLPAVLFSAHFDCVSTSFGTTDDGMGVVTLLQLIKYYATHPPRRTVLFNINNGEEDGLNGAHVLLEHPWIKNTSHPEFVYLYGSTFVNLEGASSGGRPLMFRATDLGPVKSWQHASLPHANIISAEAFNLGLIRSYTDYSVYANPLAVPKAEKSTGFAPMRGLDFAFYRGRSKYHTKFDSIPFLEGGDRALWAMMEPTWAAGVALANDDSSSPPPNEKAVFLELFNAVLVAFPLTYLLTFNITALIVGPISLILLAIAESALARSRAANRQLPTFSPSIAGDDTESAGSQVISPRGTIVNEPIAEPDDNQTQTTTSRGGWVRRRLNFPSLWKHARFWVALILSIGAQVALIAGFVSLSPFVIYRYPSIPILSSFTLAILVLSLVLSPTLPKSRIKFLSRAPLMTDVPAWTSFRTLLLHSFIFTWLLVLASTVGITQFQLGGVFYLASTYNGLLWFATVICAIVGCFGIAETAELQVVQVTPNDRRESEPSTVHVEDDGHETDANERTPLIGRKRVRIIKNKSKAGVDPVENPQPYVLWFFLLLLIVPLPLILVGHIAIFLIPSVNQTLIDGTPAVILYTIVALLSFVAAMPAIPFIGARRVHRHVLWVLGLIWVVCTGLAWIPWSGTWVGSVEGYRGGMFPFSEDAPLKVYFQQKVTLSPAARSRSQSSSSSSLLSAPDARAKIVTTISGPFSFLESMVLPLIPSYQHSAASGRGAGCFDQETDQGKVGLGHCSWETFDSTISGTDTGTDMSGLNMAMAMIPVPSLSPPSPSPPPETEPNHPNRTKWVWTSTKNFWFQAHAQAMSFNTSLTSDDLALTTAARVVHGARFFIKPNNSRACRMYFDRPVRKFRVHTIGKDDEGAGMKADRDETPGWDVQRGYESESHSMLRLWSREWDRTFVLDVQWTDSDSNSEALGSSLSSFSSPPPPQGVLSNSDGDEKTEKGKETHSGRVACEWAEYESGMVGMGLSGSPLPLPSSGSSSVLSSGAQMPAFEEILAFLPKWATVSKAADGLVEVEERFEF